MVTYEESLELEKKYYKKFTKQNLFFLYLGELKKFNKHRVEEHFEYHLQKSKLTKKNLISLKDKLHNGEN